jgi:prophage antirepressor-like protein
MSLDKTFFLDIFNQLLKINDIEIMIIFDTKGKGWFGLRDIIKVLQYSNIEKAITKIKISKINKKIYDDIEPHPGGVGSVITIKPHKIFINESGLYEILLKSTKPLAKIFTYKLLTDIIVPL